MALRPRAGCPRCQNVNDAFPTLGIPPSGFAPATMAGGQVLGLNLEAKATDRWFACKWLRALTTNQNEDFGGTLRSPWNARAPTAHQTKVL